MKPDISEKQLDVLAFPYTDYDALICDGSIRSGKTSIMTIAFIDWGMREFNNCDFGICGYTVSSAKKNIIAPYLKTYYARTKYRIKYKQSNENCLIITDGKHTNKFQICGGKDESSYKAIQGATWAGVLLDEVALMPRSFVEQALGRCNLHGSKFWFNCNPDSPKHWFYEEWICKAEEHKALHLHFHLEDNPSLSKKIIDRYKSMYTGSFYRRYIEGEWVQAEGLVYSMFDPDVHVIDAARFGLYNQANFNNLAYFYISVDYGITNPFAMYLWCVYADTAYCLKEFYYTPNEHNGYKKDNNELYADLKSFADGYDIEYVVVDPSATSFIQAICHDGYFSAFSADNAVIDGILLTTTLFKQNKIFIDKSCINLIDELGLYSWDIDSDCDRVIKENDHACDSMRYFVKSIIQRQFPEMLYGEEADERGIDE